MSQRRNHTKNILAGIGHKDEIAPKVFVNTLYRTCTTGFVVTKECVVLIDTPLVPSQARDWRKKNEEEAKSRTIDYILPTDHHRGHALGRQYFMPPQVMCPDRASKAMPA